MHNLQSSSNRLEVLLYGYSWFAHLLQLQTSRYQLQKWLILVELC